MGYILLNPQANKSIYQFFQNTGYIYKGNISKFQSDKIRFPTGVLNGQIVPLYSMPNKTISFVPLVYGSTDSHCKLIACTYDIALITREVMDYTTDEWEYFDSYKMYSGYPPAHKEIYSHTDVKPPPDSVHFTDWTYSRFVKNLKATKTWSAGYHYTRRRRYYDYIGKVSSIKFEKFLWGNQVKYINIPTCEIELIYLYPIAYDYKFSGGRTVHVEDEYPNLSPISHDKIIYNSPDELTNGIKNIFNINYAIKYIGTQTQQYNVLYEFYIWKSYVTGSSWTLNEDEEDEGHGYISWDWNLLNTCTDNEIASSYRILYGEVWGHEYIENYWQPNHTFFKKEIINSSDFITDAIIDVHKLLQTP